MIDGIGQEEQEQARVQPGGMPPGSLLRAAARRRALVDLSKNKQVDRTGRMILFVDRSTGEIKRIEAGKLRLARMRRRVRRWAEVVGPYWTDRAYLPIMVMLSYRPGVAWRPRHISEFMRKVRRRLGARLVGYAVVAELQERGAVHYHVLLVQRRGVWFPMPDKSGDWPHGASRIEKARTPYYVMKYAQKVEQKGHEFPDGLRLFAVVLRKHVAKGSQLMVLRLSVLPYWLEQAIGGEALARSQMPERRPGGGWSFGGVSYDPALGFYGVE